MTIYSCFARWVKQNPDAPAVVEENRTVSYRELDEQTESSVNSLIIEPVYETDRIMMQHREVIRAVFGVNPTEDLLSANRKYYERHIADGSHLAVVAEVDGREAECEALCFTEEFPSPDNPSGGCAYLMNISETEPVGCMDVRAVTTEIIRTL